MAQSPPRRGEMVPLAPLLWCPSEWSRTLGAAPRPQGSPSSLWDSTPFIEFSGSNSSRKSSRTGSVLPLLGAGETFSSRSRSPSGVANPVWWGVVPALWGLRPSGNQMGAMDPPPKKSMCCAGCHWLVPWEGTRLVGGLSTHGASLVPLFVEAQPGPTFLVIRQLVSSCCKGRTFPFAEK